MAQPSHDRQSVTRPVRTRFEPGHLAQACLVDAYAHLAPLWRRTRPPLPGAGDQVAGNGRTPARSRGQPPQEEPRCS
jgi:hypothetical protein